MKSILRISFLCLLMLGITMSIESNTISAQLFPRYITGVQIANLEGNSTNIAIIGYRVDGGSELPFSDTIPANSTKTYVSVKANLSGGDDFSGSFSISSDKQTAAIANVLDGNRGVFSSYIALNTDSTTVYLPLLMKENSGYSTWYSVQNVGNGEATVDITYSDGTQLNGVKIPIDRPVFFFQSREEHNQRVFAATIKSRDQPIVAAVIEESSNVMFAYTGLSHGTTEPLFPLAHQNNGGYRTGIQIQNIGDMLTSVTLSYTPVNENSGGNCQETIEISPGASATFGLRVFQGKSSPGESNCVKDQVLPGIKGGAYTSFDPAKAKNAVSFPLIMTNNGGFNTGYAIQHVEGLTSLVDCTFSGINHISTKTLPVGGSFTNSPKRHPPFDEGARYVGSVICRAEDPNTKIVGTVISLKAERDRSCNLSRFFIPPANCLIPLPGR